MLRKLDESAVNVLGYETKGRVTEEEFASFEGDFEAAISRYGKVRVFLYMPEVPGVEPGALWEDLKFARHVGDIERYAIVSDSALAEWGSRLDDALVVGTVRHFDLSQHEEAWRWLRENNGGG